MLKNFIVIAYRVMMRSKMYSLINILGLSTGIACCMLLALYIQNQASYDRQDKDLSQLYRIVSNFHGDIVTQGLNRLGTASPPLAPAAGQEIPEVTSFLRIVNPFQGKALVKYEDNLFYEDNLYVSDSTYFKFFTYDILEGNADQALVRPNSVAITDELAKKLFGTKSALNKTISISTGDSLRDYNVTVVFRKNEESHVVPNLLISMTSDEPTAQYIRSEQGMGSWAGNNFVTSYLKLVPGSDPKVVEKKLDDVLNEHGAEQMKAMGFTKTLTLEPVADIYLRSSLDQTPRIKTLYILGSIGLFILIIACINFMNLATAKAVKRAGEIGVRKVMGAVRSSLIRQILGEAVIIVLIAIVVSLLMVEIALPLFNSLTQKNIAITGSNIGFLAVVLLIIAIVTSLLSGAYPAFYLSSFQPAQVLKARHTSDGRGGMLRKSLVVVQFVISIALTCAIFIISKQLHFLQDKDLGFASTNRIVIPLRSPSAKNDYNALRSQIQGLASVAGVAGVDDPPGNFVFNDVLLYKEGSSMDKAQRIPLDKVSPEYLGLMKLKLLAGRNFVEKDSSMNVIINRSSLQAYGYTPDEAIDKPLYMDFRGEKYTFRIVGVVDDFNWASLRETIKPLGLTPQGGFRGDTYANMIVAVTGNPAAALDNIQKIWQKTVIDTPFEFSFLDQDLQRLYKDDQQIAKVIASFSIIAMFISCLGLFGLSSYMAERRFKEIGIRKVMGANVTQIVRLMSTEFLRLVLIALVIAVPIGWYMMSQWLSNFAYRIPLNGMPFLYAGMAAVIIALLTVSFESVRAAMTNPVKSLRSE